MKRLSTTLAFVFGCAALIAPHVNAQSEKEKTKFKAEDAKVVHYTGCIATGGQARTYVLQNVVPVERSSTTSPDGSVTTTTTFMLEPEATVQLEPQVGHKVEVTGFMVAPGHHDAKIESKTKVNGETVEKGKSEIGRGAPFHVTAVKPLGETCAVN